MISEKTVELNLTTELVNWSYVVTGTRPYILAPSQRSEGRLGFDVSIGFPPAGTPFLLQYKRAEFEAATNEYVYHLNRTSKRDQHLRLFVLEMMGWDVFYVLPKFHLPSQVVDNRQHLLPMALYLKPSWMIPPGGDMTGSHHITYNVATGRVTIYSDNGKRIEYWGFTQFSNLFQDSRTQKPLQQFIKDFDAVFANQQVLIYEKYRLVAVSNKDYFLYDGLAAIIK